MKILAGLMIAALLLNGCVALVAGGAGAGAVAFAKGEYQTHYEKPYDQTWHAALDALKEMGISVHNASKDGGLLEGTKKDGTSVRIILQSAGSDTTEVRVRVGKIGDDDYSQQIDRAIKQRLGIT